MYDEEMERDIPRGDDATVANTVSERTAEASELSPTTPSYVLGALIGRGGMGEVVTARDPRIGREVALKRMRGELGPEATSRFLREAKIQGRLDHPAIVPVHDLGYDADGLPYFTMKRVSGTTMASLLAAGATPQTRLLHAFVDVCRAIELAHSKRIVHRDLKPSNIMLGDFGEVYVLDWGIAHALDDGDDARLGELDPGASASTQTRTGQMLGTPGYMAPEQIRGIEIAPATDVYALGSILFEILAGEPLHPRGEAALASTLGGEVQATPSRRKPERLIAPELDAVCTHALADDLTERPTARELGERVQHYLDGDRDLERRRTLGSEHLATARACLAAGDRAGAVHAAGRAVALDPSSSDAVGLLTTLIVEPPPIMPPELVAAVEDEENAMIRQRSRRAMIPTLSFFFAITPFLPFVTIASVPLLVANYLAFAVLAMVSFVNWRFRIVPAWTIISAQLAVVVVFSRITSPFVLTPMVISMMLLSSTQLPWLNDRRWAIGIWAVLAAGLPLVLEWVGVFAPTWSMTGAGMAIHGTVFEYGQTEPAGTITGTLLVVLLIALYMRVIVRDRRVAQRRLYMQAWHLRQLLPRQPLGTVTSIPPA